MNKYYVYILASRRNGTLYVGSTSYLIRRIYEHKNNLVDGFTKKYGVHRLVYFEECDNYEAALTRERQNTEWKRRWKLEIIEEMNPEWEDLYSKII